MELAEMFEDPERMVVSVAVECLTADVQPGGCAYGPLIGSFEPMLCDELCDLVDKGLLALLKGEVGQSVVVSSMYVPLQPITAAGAVRAYHTAAAAEHADDSLVKNLSDAPLPWQISVRVTGPFDAQTQTYQDGATVSVYDMGTAIYVAATGPAPERRKVLLKAQASASRASRCASRCASL
jgi:hypothetical protein